MQKGISLIEVCISLMFLMLLIPCIIKQSQVSFNFIKKAGIFLQDGEKNDFSCKNNSYKNFKILKCTNKKHEISYRIAQ